MDTFHRKYVWRETARIKGVTPDDAVKVLNEIAARDGSIQPQAVVDEARPKDSIIHPAFEWRDTIAAEEHRKWQARNLIRCVRTVSEPDPTRPADERTVKVVTTPAFVFTGGSQGNEDKPAGYYPAAKVITDMELFDRAMNEALQKLRSAERSVEDLKALAEKSEQRETLTALTIALTSLSVATAAIREVRH
jgi:hypothetical protein